MKIKLVVLLVASFLLLVFVYFAAPKTAKFVTGIKYNKATQNINQSDNTYQKTAEIQAILAARNPDEQVGWYKKLIERAGPQQAQEELYNSGLPFDGQSHLLNHTVGEWLYDKYATSGLAFCQDYFLSSCYHGFVIKAVAQGGFEALQSVMETCQEKGYHVAIQCSHSIGHGFLAYDGYANLIKALTDCDKLELQSKNFPLYNCHDGVFMENIWAIHEGGNQPSKFAWLKDNDPLYPCNEAKIPSKYIKACWSNQPMRLYRMFAADLVAAGQVCLNIKDQDHQATCFDGLARQIHPETHGNIDEVFRMCNFMPESWVSPCIKSIVKAFFSVGDQKIPFAICQRMRVEEQKSCYEELIGIIRAYIKTSAEREKLCQKLPQENYQSACIKL